MKAAVVGASGQIGGWLTHWLRQRDIQTVGSYATVAYDGLEHLDTSDHTAATRWVERHQPEVIFYPAGWTWVDGCEKDPARALAANVADPLNVARAGLGHGSLFVYYSTDYLFDGTDGPNTETDTPKPLSVYGRVKLEAEEQLATTLGDHFLCLRTAWVQGPERQGKNFTYQVWRNLSQGKAMVCPSDQVSNPTYGPDLAKVSVELALGGHRGIWNVAGPDLWARDELGRQIARHFGFDPGLIIGKTTAELGQPAARPLLGGLDTAKLQRVFPKSLRPLHEWLSDFVILCEQSRFDGTDLPVTPPEALAGV